MGFDAATQAYCSAVVLVKFPLLPLALIWLLPKEMSGPRVGIYPRAVAADRRCADVDDRAGRVGLDAISQIGDDARLLDREIDLARVRKYARYSVCSDDAVAHRPGDDAGPLQVKAMTEI